MTVVADRDRLEVQLSAAHEIIKTLRAATDCERIWAALLHKCASHRPDEHHKVKHLVMVSKEDIRAALKRSRTDGE
jgi:hypothetical protein